MKIYQVKAFCLVDLFKLTRLGFMIKEYRPRIEYFNLFFILVFTFVFVWIGEFDPFELIGLAAIDFIRFAYCRRWRIRSTKLEFKTNVKPKHNSSFQHNNATFGNMWL